MKTTSILHLPYPESTDSADVPRDIKALAEKLDSPAGAGGVFIVGEVRLIAVAVTPAGWLPCDGAAVSRATYAALFAAIAAVFGAGDGSATFNVPDTRGRALVGAGAGAGLTARVVGTKWGVEAVVVSTAQMPAHNHAVTDPTHSHVFSGMTPSGTAAGPSGSTALYVPQAQNVNTAVTGLSIQNNGGGQGHDNTQPSIAIPAYIYAGV